MHRCPQVAGWRCIGLPASAIRLRQADAGHAVATPTPIASMPSDTAKSWASRPMFLTFNGRRLFALDVTPKRPCLGNVLYFPAFAEEMNRFRSHAAQTARMLAAQGFQCLLLDPFGTGESDGDIADGDWEIWLDDAVAAARWMQSRNGQPLTLWGVRTGALLAAEVAARLAAAGDTPAQSLLLWQPVADGKQFLNQYLRLRIASQLVQEAERETTETIRAKLRAGEVLEIAGYPLTGTLADSLAARRLDQVLGTARPRVDWIEVVARPDSPLALPSRKLLDQWTAAGLTVASEAVSCPMVWQVHERVEAPELTAATLRLMAQESTA